MNSDAESSIQSSPLTSRDLSMCLYNNSPDSEGILEMKQTLANLTKMAEMVCSQNAFLVQKLTELENSAPSSNGHSCECSRLRAEVENKSAHLKQAYGAMNDLKKRSIGQRNIDQICLRCGGAERQVVSLPCAHVGVCKPCAKLTNNCFICGRKQDSCLEISFRR